MFPRVRTVFAVLFVTLGLLAEPVSVPAADLNQALVHGESLVFTARWQHPEPVLVSSKVDLVQIINFNHELVAGTRIYIDQPREYPWQLQSSQVNEDNFVSVVLEGTVNIRAIQRGRVKTLPAGPQLIVVAELASGLFPGQTLEVHYTNLRVPAIAGTGLLFPLYIAGPAQQLVQGVISEGLTMSPGPIAGIQIAAPTVLQPDQPFDVRLLAADSFGNPIQGRIPPLELIVDGTYDRRIPGGEGPVQTVSAVRLAAPGLHRIEVRTAGGGIRGQSDVIYVTENVDFSVLWGDFHLHDTSSGGLLAADELQNQIFADLDAYSIVDKASPLAAQETRNPLIRGGHLLNLGTDIQVVLGDVPTDHRRLDVTAPVLAEIVAGNTAHEWLGQRLAGYGFKAAFLGSRTSHDALGIRGRGKTAVLVPKNGSWINALRAGNTYVVSEGKPLLFCTVNGALPGHRIRNAAKREITGEVHASYGLHKIELLKNGVVIDQRIPSLTKTGVTVPESDTIHLRLSSPNRPHDPPWDIPRNGREWIGFFRVTGARIGHITASNFRGHPFKRIAVNPMDPTRIDFITWTRGNSSSFLVDLVPTENDTIVELSIMEGFEDTSHMPHYRAPSATPAIRQLFAVDDLRDGIIARTFDADGYKDRVEISLFNQEVTTSYSFYFTDSDNVRAGDYYYLRVTGLEDETIWSSPVYVGGFDVVN